MRNGSFVLVVLSLALGAPALGASPSIKVDKETYKAEETVTVEFSGADGYPRTAWIGVIPSSVAHGDESLNDRNDVDYRYLEARSSGTLTFKAPAKPGAWDVRLNDGQGHEVAHAAFEVMRPDYGRAKLELSSSAFDPGAKIEVRFTAPDGLASNAWIGLLPASVPHGDEALNDRNDLAYQYFRASSGTLSFTAPEKGGAYDFRMHSGDPGEEIASVAFTVKSPDLAGARLSVEKETFIPGETIPLTFAAPEGLSPRAWIGIVPAAIPHGSETENDKHDLAYEYLHGRRSGTLHFRAPTDAGEYTFRMHDTDQDGSEIASVAFRVTGSVDADALQTQLDEHGRVSVYGIRFATNQTSINAESAQALTEIAALLKKDPALRLRIEGHTDNVGDEAYNRDLSNRRAASVKEHLVKVHGIDAARLATEGLGESKPVAPNDTEAGRAQNRRVELVKE